MKGGINDDKPVLLLSVYSPEDWTQIIVAGEDQTQPCGKTEYA